MLETIFFTSRRSLRVHSLRSKKDQPRFRINKWSEVFDTIKECAVFDVFLTGLLVRRDSICGRT